MILLATDLQKSKLTAQIFLSEPEFGRNISGSDLRE